jgi:multiple sugar transport system substrate-binding protein
MSHRSGLTRLVPRRWRQRLRPVRPEEWRSAGALSGGAVALGVAAALIGATVTSGTPRPWPSPGEGSAGPKPTVRVLTGTDTSLSSGDHPVHGQQLGMYQQLAAWWNDDPANQSPDSEARTGIRIEVDTVTGGASLAHAQMLAAAQSGQEQADVLNLDSQWIPEFAQAGLILPLDGQQLQRPGDFRPASMAGARWDGHQYAVPFTADAALLYYRTGLGLTPAQIRRAHDPLALAALAERARKAHPEVGGITEDYVGQFARYEGLTVNTLEAVWGRDPAAFTASGNVRDAGAVRQQLADLGKLFADGAAPAGELQYQENQALQDFRAGRAVFFRGWTIDDALLQRYARAKSPDPLGTRYARTVLPFPSVLGGQDLAVAASTGDRSAALAVIDYLTSPESEQCLMNVGGFSATRQSVYGLSGTPGGRHRECGTTAPQVPTGVVKAALANARPRPATRYYTEWSEQLQNLVAPYLQESADHTSGSRPPDLSGPLAAAARGSPAQPPQPGG